MEISMLLEDLKKIISESQKVPFSDKIIVDKEQLTGMIDEMIFKLPDELKQAQWITKAREQILEEAQKDAAEIIKEAEDRILSMVDEHEITKKAFEKKDEIMLEANNQYREMKEGAKSYIDGILENIEVSMVELGKSLSNIEQEFGKNISNMEQTVNSEIERIKNNRQELK